MRFLLICVFSSQVFVFQFCPNDKKKATSSLAGDCPIWFFVFVFFFLASVHVFFCQGALAKEVTGWK